MHQFANSQPKIYYSDLKYPERENGVNQNQVLNLTNSELIRLRVKNILKSLLH
jgi:hypothetical protein